MEITVRKAANLHTGGTIHDVTEIVHPDLVDAACQIARAIKIPVVGIDFMVRDPAQPDYVFIEANERPALPITSHNRRRSVSSNSSFRQPGASGILMCVHHHRTVLQETSDFTERPNGT